MLQKAPANPQAAAESEIDAVLRQGGAQHRLRRFLYVLAVCAAVGVGAWYWLSASAAGPTVTYATAPVTRGNLVVTVTATGAVQPTNQVDVSSELSGTVGSVAVDFNDIVHSGQILATLKTDKLEANVAQARAELAAREAEVVQARAGTDQSAMAFDRAGQLHASGVTTQEAYDAAKAASDRAVAVLAAAEANREIARANLLINQSDLAKAEIVSPIDGVVLARNLEVGQTVAASSSAPVLFTLADDLAKMQLEVDVDEADVGKVSQGDQATFTVAAFENQSFSAEVAQIRYAPAKVEGVVTYKAILSVDNSDLLLRPGMTATAEISVDEVNGALLVPNAALRYAPEDAGRGATGIAALFDMLRRGGRPPAAAGPDGVAPRAASDQARPGTLAEGGAPRAAAALRQVWVLRGDEPVAVAVETGVTDGALTQIVGGGLTEQDAVIVGARTAS
jgi:HlyD family secretion protein